MNSTKPIYVSAAAISNYPDVAGTAEGEIGTTGDFTVGFLARRSFDESQQLFVWTCYALPQSNNGTILGVSNPTDGGSGAPIVAGAIRDQGGSKPAIWNDPIHNQPPELIPLRGFAGGY